MPTLILPFFTTISIIAIVSLAFVVNVNVNVSVNAFSVGSSNSSSSARRRRRSSRVGGIGVSDGDGDGDGVESEEQSPKQQQKQSRNFIEITSFSDGPKQSLPASIIETWPTWVLDTDGKVDRIPDNNGFVTPTSIDNLWQPIDLIRPTMKVALGVHIRNGSIRHVFPAVDISYDQDDDHRNRNRGLCSVPRAHTWVDIAFLNSLGDYNRYELRVSSKQNDNEGDNKGDDNKWQQLLSSSSYASSSNSEVISKAIERVVIFLAENDDSESDSDSNDDFGAGSNILHVILDTDNGDDNGDRDKRNENEKKKLVCKIPKTSHDLKVTMVEMYGNDQKIENIGYEDVDVGILQVTVATTMSGSESEYLPDVYRPLFDDPKLKNPLYGNYKDRRQKAITTNGTTTTTKEEDSQNSQ
mmetsp:Transcript_744/g.812  ORF Transcript_744/g.812 Transcript_744/m.812 type:complete len:412 (-) Transcript_744:26-1261(-)